MKSLGIFFLLLAGAYGGILPQRIQEGKIVGGIPAQIEDVPYQVALMQNFNGIFYQVCGGSIISRSAILTAAHCTDKVRPSLWKVRAGSTFYNIGGQVLTVLQINQHPGYSLSMNNDISIMTLTAPLLLGPSVAIVSLPAQGDEVADNLPALVAGWGYLSEGSNTSPIQLYKVVVPIINRNVCASMYKNFNAVSVNMICAGYSAGQLDACQGDSGGPLVVNNIQYGITSWGRGCARPNSPGVYTRVSNYISWMTLSRSLFEKNPIAGDDLPEETNE